LIYQARPHTIHPGGNRFAGGRAEKVDLDEVIDLRKPGVERFMTLPKDQTEG
jgi:hypothetical protein